MDYFFLPGCCYVLSAQMKPKAAESVPADTQNIVKQESNIWDVFKDRRSVRKFTSDSIPEADINKILDAARMAPTSGNQQPWKFLVVRDRNKINRMKEACIIRIAGRYDKNTMKETKEQFEENGRRVIRFTRSCACYSCR